ncbi:tetratricopeptide repeat protein [Corynebacterium aurimucosum]|uniref:Tetratricopeptide repeat protein n=1 Tax=Corynebacterium aurimucosum TaxID=169292 RepID=A0A558GGI9_9CORY|nr:tetratricopeptide repeat protein [Corynebacterium aurimucosum]
MSESNSRDHERGREGFSESNRGNSRSGGRKFEKRGGASGRRQERRGDRRGGRDGANPRRNNPKRHGRDKNKASHPQRSGYREERINRRMTDPDLPSDIDITDLDPSVLQDLSSLSKENSEAVAKHLIMAATWLDDDPQLSLRHARAAKDRAGRVSVAREMNGIAAYRAGEWKEALAELRAARRISGGPGLMAVMADCERGLGRPEKAVELWRSEDAKELAPEDAIELAIVAAGARLDMDQADSAVVTIQRAQPTKDAKGVSACRLAYAYANALLEAGRKDEAREWFQHAIEIDEGDWTDAAERLAECK